MARTILRDVETQCAAGDFASVDLLHRLCRVFLCCESNERETPRPPSFAIFGNVNVDDFTDFPEELSQLLVGRAVIEVPYEYLA